MRKNIHRCQHQDDTDVETTSGQGRWVTSPRFCTERSPGNHPCEAASDLGPKQCSGWCGPGGYREKGAQLEMRTSQPPPGKGLTKARTEETLTVRCFEGFSYELEYKNLGVCVCVCVVSGFIVCVSSAKSSSTYLIEL